MKISPTNKKSQLSLICWAAALFFLIIGCSARQKVLLIGTHHRLPAERTNETIPIAEALRRFNPEVICVEYPKPSDTLSLLSRYTDLVFHDIKAKKEAWNVASDHDSAIASLKRHLRNHPRDFQKRMELQQRYFLSHDGANADLQGYLIFKNLARGSVADVRLRSEFLSYETLKLSYDYLQASNNEYYLLVFPLAEALNISYLYPIDDQSTMKTDVKYYNQLQRPDTTDTLKTNYQKRMKVIDKRIDSLTKENMYLAFNSPNVIKDLLILEGYTISGSDSLNVDILGRHNHWVLRNKTMAQYIDEVAQDQSTKNVVVFFGASHVGPVREELNKLKKKYKVLTLFDVLDSTGIKSLQ